MTKEKKLNEAYAVINGWEKVEGVKFNIEGLEEDWDEVYFENEQFKDRTTQCTFWQYTEAEENVYEDIDDVVDYIEDHMNVPDFETYKKSTK